MGATEMSNDISTGSLPVNISSNNSHKSLKTSGQSSHPAPVQAEQHNRADIVKLTDKVLRLQEIESLLAAIPPVNDKLVAEIGQAIADGSFEIDPERVASMLIEMESGVLNTDNA